MRQAIIAICAVVMMSGAILVTTPLAVAVEATPIGTVAKPAAAGGCTDRYLLVPAWYKGMQSADCTFEPVQKDGKPDARVTAIKIAMNIIQALLVVAGYVTLFFIIKGGFKYIYSAGDTNGMTESKKTITNAIIGLILAILAASIVNAIAGLI